VENNIFSDLYISIMVDAGDNQCVFAYNYSRENQGVDPTYQLADVYSGHGAHPIMNLYEGNLCERLQCDFFWGSSSHTTVFRNYFTGSGNKVTYNRICVSIDSWNQYYNLVGNVLGSDNITRWIYDANETNDISNGVNLIYRIGYPGSGNNRYILANYAPGTNDLDLRVKANLIRHGNYDYANHAVVWEQKILDHNLPNSLYLTNKPTWWGTNRWPAFGPDLDPMATKIPAQSRYEQTLSKRPGAPQSIRVIQ
jgi:hypothetical protein